MVYRCYRWKTIMEVYETSYVSLLGFFEVLTLSARASSDHDDCPFCAQLRSILGVRQRFARN